MKENLEKLKLLSRDLRDGKQYPAQPCGIYRWFDVYDLEEERL